MGSVTWGQPILGGERQPWETGQTQDWPLLRQERLGEVRVSHMHIAHLQPCPSLPAGTASCLLQGSAEGRTGQAALQGRAHTWPSSPGPQSRPHSCNPGSAPALGLGDTMPRLVSAGQGRSLGPWKLGDFRMKPRDPQRHTRLLGPVSRKGGRWGVCSNPDSAPFQLRGWKSHRPWSQLPLWGRELNRHKELTLAGRW